MLVEVLQQIQGLLVNILSSFVFWWIFFALLVPKIGLSPYISKTETNDGTGGYRYRIKVSNLGFRRVIDIRIQARIRIKGLKAGYPRNWEIVHIPLDYDNIASLSSRKRGNSHMLRLFIHDVEQFCYYPFPQEFTSKYKKQRVSLEEILSLGTKAEVRITAFGHDELSVTRKLFTGRYDLRHIRHGSFERGSLYIKPRDHKISEKALLEQLLELEL